MILDRLENAELYRPLGKRIALALDYLRRTDFSRTPDGRYDLDANQVFAIVSRYRPKPLVEARWEAHRQYVDVQYVAEGIERMGYAPLSDGVIIRQAYDPQKDLVFYDAQGDFFHVAAGSFAIFAPNDVHAPGLAADPSEGSENVCKVVVKCRVEAR
jgi:biofilm protein TabA